MENKEELIEKLAEMEHARWARWQEYLHSKCAKNPDGSLAIPSELVIHWERQISTPYSQLSEREKESDRKEVRPYIELAVLADKQGYMRGYERGKQVGAANELARNLINSLYEIDPELLKHHPEYQELRDQLKDLQEQLQAHDAISKLKERI